MVELAAFQIARLRGVTPRAVRICAKKNKWPYREKKGRGGAQRFYKLTELPVDIQSIYLEKMCSSLHSPADAISVTPLIPQNTSDLKHWQRSVVDGRAGVLRTINSWVLEAGITQGKAISRLLEMIKNGNLPEHLEQLILAANGRAGGKLKLSRATVYNWIKAQNTQGVAGLAPNDGNPGLTIPDWADPLLSLYGDPRKPSLAAVMEKLPKSLPKGLERPSYDAARRFLKSLTAVTRHTGRMGPRDLKSLKAYVKRDVSELWPGAVYASDGHTFKAEVQHPIHGGPFRPEVTPVIDVYTRRIVGWSAGLAESTWTVLDAARHSFMTSSLCDIWYTDNGSGFKNKVMRAPLIGFMARWSVTCKNSLAYGSQARGVIERWHQTMTKAARELPTYMGKDMDAEAKQKAFKITRADMRRFGSSKLLLGWPEFLEYVQSVTDTYNDRPHSSLPRIRDAVTFKRRYMTPNEVWQKSIDEGWQPDPVTEAQADDMFRPYEIRKTNRALVSLFGNEYFGGNALEAFHGEEVMVGYDVHDASKVWVRELIRNADEICEGRLICTAEWGGNRQSYYPVSVAEQARDKRLAGRIKRLDVHKAEALAERHSNPLIEMGGETPMTETESAMADAMFEKLENPLEPVSSVTSINGRPVFHDDLEFAVWAEANPTALTREDYQLLSELMNTRPFRILLETEGVDIPQLSDVARKGAA